MAAQNTCFGLRDPACCDLIIVRADCGWEDSAYDALEHEERWEVVRGLDHPDSDPAFKEIPRDFKSPLRRQTPPPPPPPRPLPTSTPTHQHTNTNTRHSCATQTPTHAASEPSEIGAVRAPHEDDPVTEGELPNDGQQLQPAQHLRRQHSCSKSCSRGALALNPNRTTLVLAHLCPPLD